MDSNKRPIGFFDSGVGGISVLREALKLMPEENYIYFGDSENAPYGEKETIEVKKLTIQAVKQLVELDCKAIVIACNTATSAAIREIRKNYKGMPIIGIEPALKPAIEESNGGKVLIMATPITLREAKFTELLNQYNKNNDIELVPCPGLAELIESGNIKGALIEKYLREKLNMYRMKNVSQIVLGCTHYPFVENEIKKVFSQQVNIIHGGEGTVKQLKRELEHYGIKNDSDTKGYIKVINSKDEELVQFCYSLI